MQWNGGANAGFSAGKPWLPVPASAAKYNVASELKEPESILSFYRRVLALRHSEAALIEGEYVALNESDPNVLAYLRRAPQETILVALNMSGVSQNVAVDLDAVGMSGAKVTTLVSTTTHPVSEVLKTIVLDPFSVYVGKISK